MLRIALLFLLLSGATSCSVPDRRVVLALEEGLEEYVKSLPPLPKGWTYWKNGPSEPGVKKGGEAFRVEVADTRVEVIRFPPEGVTPAISPPKSKLPLTRNPPSTESSPTSSWEMVFEKTLSKLPYAPRTSYLDPTTTIEPREFALFSLYPLDTVQLPYKALRVGGLAPNDKEYPYLGKVLLRIFVRSALPSDSPSNPVTPASQPGGTIFSSSATSSLKALIHWAESIRPQEEERLLWIGAVGDVLPGRGVETLLLRGERGVSHVFGDTISVLQRQDLLLGNLEGPLTTRGSPANKAYTFRFPPAVLEILKKVGFNYFSLTNNHVLDFGREGLLDTLKAFETYGVGTSGIGRSPEEAKIPWKFIVPGSQPFHVLSVGAYPPEKSGFDGRLEASVGIDRPGILWALEETLEALPEWFGSGGFNILMVHGGYEWASIPHREQVRLYRRFIDTGADIVFGSHPHVVQGMESYGGGLIFYSLGNFLFPGMEETPGGEESIIVSCGVYKGKVRYLEVYPVQLQGTTVRMDPSLKTLNRFYQLSRALRELYP